MHNYPSLPNFIQTFVLPVDRKYVPLFQCLDFSICVSSNFPSPCPDFTHFSSKVPSSAPEPLHKSPDMTSPEGEEVGTTFQIVPWLGLLDPGIPGSDIWILGTMDPWQCIMGSLCP